MGHNQKRDETLGNYDDYLECATEYKMAEFSLVVEAPPGLKKLVIGFFFFGEGVGRVKSTISSAADSSESLNRPPEALFQDISDGDGVAVDHLLEV